MPRAVFADGEERIVLKMAEQSLNLKDTLSARTYLDKITPQCTTSDSWEVRFKFYSLRGYLNSLDTQNLAQAASDLHKAYLLFPDTATPTQEYLWVAYHCCQAFYDKKSYWLGEYIAEKSLLRCLDIVNDCFASAPLFTLLAEFYEQRGDTIMPRHFHRKSQEISIKQYYHFYIPSDSLPVYYKRLQNLFNGIDNYWPIFSRRNPELLFTLDELNHYVWESGNEKETIYLSEYITKTARDSMLLESSWGWFHSFAYLLHAYAKQNQLEKALDMLPEVEAYYARYPDSHITKSLLYFAIGLGLFDSNGKKTEEVIYYLNLAKKGLSEKYHSDAIHTINIILTLCEEN